MEGHRSRNLGPKGTIINHPTRQLESSASLELQSNTLTAGGDIYLNIKSGYTKQPLLDTQQLADWLSSLNQHQFHKDVFDKVTTGTGEWIFSDPKFRDWLAGNIEILWGTGIPGAGKTCLSSVIINHLIHREQKTVVFLYCQYKEQPSINEILACLLKQMVENSEMVAQHVAMTLYASCIRTNTRPSRSELSKTLNETAQKFDGLFFVVDALDELQDDTRFDLVTELAALQRPFLMTSRPLPNLLDLTPTQFDIRPPESDFITFISATISRVSRLRPFLRDSGLRAEIIKTIQDKCGGMFLLAALQVEALASTGIFNARGLREAVNRLPNTLKHQYKDTFQRIQSQSPEERDLALRILSWVTHATRHLRVDELLEALTVNSETASVDENQRTTEETLISVCLGLLTVENKSRMVRLIHFTAQEFFVGQHGILLKSPHEYIANVCAVYLSWIQVNYPNYTSYDEMREHNSEIPLIQYACCSLGHHAYQAIIEDTAHLPTDVATLFTERGRASIPFRLFGDQIDFGHPIHFAAAYGLVPLFEEHEGRIDQESVLGYTALFYACLGGRLALVERILIQHPASLTCNTKSGATLLHAAVESGDVSVVKVLLPMCGLESPLPGAVQPASAPTLSITGDAHIDINAQMLDGRTALYIASEAGNLPIIESLLNHTSLNPNLGQNYGRTPLHISSAIGHERVVQLLLNYPRIDVNAEDNIGLTPLIYALSSRHESITRLLLNAGVNLNTLTKAPANPFHVANAAENSSLMKLPLTYPEIGVNVKDIVGYAPLHYAVGVNDKSAIQMLLDSGADINVAGSYGTTPLYMAANNGNTSIVQLLLSSPGMDVNSINRGDNEGITALHLAVYHGHTSIVQLLLSSLRMDVNAINRGDNEGSTPLHVAAINGSISIVRLFLSVPGIDVAAKERQTGCIALHYAAYHGHAAVAEALLSAGEVDINAKEMPLNSRGVGADVRCNHGCTPLTLASERGHTDIVRILLDRTLANINNTDDDGSTPLMCAACNGHTSVARLLLDQPEIQVNVQDKEHGRTALSWACDASKTPVVGGTKTEGEAHLFIVLLLEHKDIDINLADKEGKTPLYYASRSGFQQVVELLKRRGAVMENTPS